MNDAVTYTLSNEQVDKLAKYRELAANAKRTNVNERASTIDASISFLLDFAIDEQIRRFEKQVADAKSKLETAAKAAFYEKMISAKGDAKKIEELLNEMTSIKK